MALYTPDDMRLRIEIAPAKGHTVHGGQVAVAAMCKKLGLWALTRAERALDPRRDRTRGFAPVVMAAQLGVTRFADQTQLGEWLRGLGLAGLAALRRVLRRTVARALELCPAGTVRTGGELEVFFDDTQLEVTGKRSRAPRSTTRAGSRSAGRRCSSARSSPPTPRCVARRRATSLSREGQHLERVRAGFPRWSISCNRWTEPLERAAAALPAHPWTAVPPDGHYAYVRHQPAGCAEPQVYAVRR